ncbi:DUF4376 domain-containing protein [Sphingomonas sp. Leaf22]|uniref:DUF4376 domain-containing protein n=1 Tax=Sphingomonas sp. Leaf22 TaxID=1735687 RepID=UPI0012E29093|nr:DUF4376 domain-containing protein [Sphingomonas sp. Leaf22]
MVDAVVSILDLETLLLNTPEGSHPVPCGDAAIVPGEWLWDGSGFVEREVPGPTLAERRAEVWGGVRAARDQAEWWGCSTPLGRADSDPDSQRKVAGAVQMAMIAQAAGAPFSIDWTMQDNRSVTHDAVAMITLGVAVGQHVAACHAVALAKRAAIEAAADAATLVDFDIEGGWPDAPIG